MEARIEPEILMHANIKNLLSVPSIYRLFTSIIGGSSSRQRLVREFVRPVAGMKILDVGCGPADIVEFLPDVRYLGFDASEAYISEARDRWRGRGEFFCSTVNTQTLQEGDFDLVLALGVLHHLDDDEARAFFTLAHTVLRPGGRLITLDGVYVKDQSPIARFIIGQDRGAYVRESVKYENLATMVFGTVAPTVLHDLIAPVPYTHLVMECLRS